MNESSPPSLALYIHWPFCVSKCPYCDFNSHVRGQVDQAAWLRALIAEILYESDITREQKLKSIFFGGGTPSLMPPATVAAIIDAARSAWKFVDEIEITLEANPSSVEASRFADLATAGVNRVSLGVQSFDDAALTFLGRAHGAAEARRAIATAQEHFSRVSFDLIYALPDQGEAQWRRQLADALAIGTGHLSLYQLTIEPGTRFATLAREKKLEPLDDDRAAELYAVTQELTEAAGLPYYEVSNHARPGEESRHNLTYWRQGDYVGIGPGAHGRRGGVATFRHKKPETWLARVQERGDGLKETEALSLAERAREALVMGLRLREGVDVAALERRFGQGLIDEQAWTRLQGHGLTWRDDGRVGVTSQGMPLLDAVLRETVAA